MKSPRCWIGSGLALLFLAPEAPGRVFRNQAGREIDAEIVAVRGPNVELAIQGKVFLVPLATLSPEDQTHVAEWARDHRVIPLDFRATRQEDSQRRRTQGDREDRSEFRAFRYETALTNRSGETLGNLEIKYNLIVRHTRTAKERKETGRQREESAQIIAGAATIPSLENTRQAAFQTDWLETQAREWKVKKIAMIRDEEGRLVQDPYWDEYTTETQLDGIWVKVFLEGRQVSEWKSEGKLIKEVSWSDVSREAGSGSGPVRSNETSTIHPDLAPIPPIPEPRRQDPLLRRLWQDAARLGSDYQLAVRLKRGSNELRDLRAEYADALARYAAELAK